MKTYFVEVYACQMQHDMYKTVSEKAKKHPVMGALAGVPLAFADITLETLKSPLQIIEGLALAIINLLGVLFHEECSIKDLLLSLEKTLTFAIHTPIALVLAPFKFIYQAANNVYAPSHVKPYNTAAKYTAHHDLIVHENEKMFEMII